MHISIIVFSRLSFIFFASAGREMDMVVIRRVTSQFKKFSLLDKAQGSR